jgi:hypothetical protein
MTTVLPVVDRTSAKQDARIKRLPGGCSHLETVAHVSVPNFLSDSTNVLDDP